VEGFESRESCRDGDVIGTMVAKERQSMKMTTVLAYSLLCCVCIINVRRATVLLHAPRVGIEYGL
jgi:hypothetical protein